MLRGPDRSSSQVPALGGAHNSSVDTRPEAVILPTSSCWPLHDSFEVRGSRRHLFQTPSQDVCHSFPPLLWCLKGPRSCSNFQLKLPHVSLWSRIEANFQTFWIGSGLFWIRRPSDHQLRIFICFLNVFGRTTGSSHSKKVLPDVFVAPSCKRSCRIFLRFRMLV